MAFVDNFGLSELDKSRILRLFGGQLVTIEPAQFYAFLRLCGHVKQGRSLRKELAFVSAPVPKPRSILSKRKALDGNTSDRGDSPDVTSSNPFRKSSSASISSTTGGPKDMDSFMSLMTGRASSVSTSNGRRKKRVTFDSAPPQVAEAAQRSMEELLRQRGVTLPSAPAPAPPPPPQPEPPQEEEPEVEINNNSHFAHVNIDSVLVHGTSVVPPAPPPRRLTPNMTGPTQMVQMGALPSESTLSAVGNSALQPNHTGQLPGPVFPVTQYRGSSPQLQVPGYDRPRSHSQPLVTPPSQQQQPYVNFQGHQIPSSQSSQPHQPSPQNLSPMPTGMDFLNAVSHPEQPSMQRLSPASTGYARPQPMAPSVQVGSEYDIAPPPQFSRRANPYDTQNLRNQVNNLW